MADSFDAMTSSRPYCDARAFDGAVAEVERCSGSQFDPEVAGAFVAAFAAGEIVAAEPLSLAV